MNNFQKNVVEGIAQDYTEKKTTKYDELVALDRKVKTPAQITAYTLGIISALIFGTGMCLAMKVIGDMVVLGVIVGVLGLGLCCANYFLYKSILNSRKKKYSKKILELTKELLN